jgi:hypothetical protein
MKERNTVPVTAPKVFPPVTGRILLASSSQVALWQHELLGQLSDGAWKDAPRQVHHLFWCKLQVRVLAAGDGMPRVETPCGDLCTRDRYSDALLFADHDLIDRMVRVGRMALACEILGIMFRTMMWSASADMPETYDGYRRSVVNWMDLPASSALARVLPELAQVYYDDARCQAYGIEQVKADIRVIKRAMKNRFLVTPGV